MQARVIENNKSEEFRELLVGMVKAAGQDMIDRAEELVGNGDLITDFDIWVRFPINERYEFDASPTIEVTRSNVAKNAFKTLVDHYIK